MTTESLHEIARTLFEELQREDKDAAVFLNERHFFSGSSGLASTTYEASIVSDKMPADHHCVRCESNDLKLAIETVMKEYRLATTQHETLHSTNP